MRSFPTASTTTARSAPIATSSWWCARWNGWTGLKARAICCWSRRHENPCADRDGAEPRQVHRVSHLFRHLQERLDQPRRHGIRLVQQRRNQARHRLPEGLGKSEALEWWLAPQEKRQDRAAHRLEMAGAGEHLRQPGPTGDRRLLRAFHLRLRASAEIAGNDGDADGASALANQRR